MDTMTMAGLALMWIALAGAVAFVWRRIPPRRGVGSQEPPARPATPRRAAGHGNLYAHCNYRQLYELALERDIAGRLSMNKAQLLEALAKS